jgi:hypothetical protein
MANMFFVRIDVLSDSRSRLMLSLIGPLQLCPYPYGRLDLRLICASPPEYGISSFAATA